MPYGNGVFFKGKYQKDPLYKLYVQTFTCSFDLKPGKIPTIQIKNSYIFLPNEYVKSSNNELVTLTLTNIDLELFFENYNVTDITYDSGWKFKGIKGLFTEYIDYWSNKKIEAKKDKNFAMYRISKLMLNSLYGKFGLNPKIRGKFPFLENDVVHYGFYSEETRDPIYIPVATFITSYARRKTITTSQKIRDYTISKYGKDLYIYSDTDSIHVELKDGEELKDIIDIDDYKLGAWKLESQFKKGRFIRQKCYIEQDYNESINVTVAGLPKALGELINFENFNIGFTTENIETDKKKLTYKHVKGGVLLAPTDFTIVWQTYYIYEINIDILKL